MPKRAIFKPERTTLKAMSLFLIFGSKASKLPFNYSRTVCSLNSVPRQISVQHVNSNIAQSRADYAASRHAHRPIDPPMPLVGALAAFFLALFKGHCYDAAQATALSHKQQPFFPQEQTMKTIKTGLFTPRKILALLALALAFAGISSLSVQSTDAPAISHDGLHLDTDSSFALLYVKPDADFSVYTQFLMLDAYVAFKKNWQRKTKVAGRRVSNRDMERIKGEAAKLLHESFKKELDEVGGYTFVEKADDQVMILRPALIDLVITAPDIAVAGRVTQYVASAGSATLYIELYDSVSGEILARAIDRRNMQNYGVARWANKVTNRADASRMFKRWASLLRVGMDEVRVEAGLPPIKGA
jgi:hypothetical protein